MSNKERAERMLGVMGAGISGWGAAQLAVARGWSVFLSDKGRIESQITAWCEANGVEYEQGAHTPERLLACDTIVKSPGIPQTAPIIRQLREAGVKIISEIEFASRYTSARLIGITGSNGKTTTTSLIHHILRTAGWSVEVGGNIGQSMAQQVLADSSDCYVVELSSFQLEDVYDLRLDAAVLLNITPDHLDRYEHSMERYAEAKFRIARNMLPSDILVYSGDDSVVAGCIASYTGQAQLMPFSVHAKPDKPQAAWLEEGAIHARVDGRAPWQMPLRELAIAGLHNAANSMAAALVTLALGVKPDTIKQAIASFSPIEHRLEFVRTCRGVRYINDSKATNVDAVWYALESMTTPVVLIAGGTDKGNDYAPLRPLAEGRVKALVCMGVENGKLLEAFGGTVPRIVEARSANEAVQLASELAEAGDTVLLSPACASFDLFKNYEDRGRQFKAAVMNLPE